MDKATQHRVTDVETLDRLYPPAVKASLVKETDYIHPLYRAFIEKAPFAVLATAGATSLDASPRGDSPCVAVVEDAKTLLIPDRRGNNRLDSLRNIVADPRVALLFLIPGVAEAIRVNGKAVISTAPLLLERFRVGASMPRTVIVVSVESVYFQCSRSVLRSRVWEPSSHVDRETLPSIGAILGELAGSPSNWQDYGRDLDRRLRSTLY